MRSVAALPTSKGYIYYPMMEYSLTQALCPQYTASNHKGVIQSLIKFKGYSQYPRPLIESLKSSRAFATYSSKGIKRNLANNTKTNSTSKVECINLIADIQSKLKKEKQLKISMKVYLKLGNKNRKG